MTTLPQAYRDAGFQRRIGELERAEALGGRNEVWQMLLEEPWVTDHPFRGPNTETHCPHGHVNAHEIGVPHVNHEGRECVRRRCVSCESTWLEPLP